MKSFFTIPLIIVALASMSSCTDFREEESQIKLQVDKTELSFPSFSDPRIVEVKSGAKWSVSPKPDWVSVKSITSSQYLPYTWSVTFVSEPNTGYDRTGVITISTQDQYETIEVTQSGLHGKYVAVESVSLPDGDIVLMKGQSASLSYDIQPADASVKDVTWISSSPSVATVDETGLVKAVDVGTATITVATNDGWKTATCSVKVNPVSVTGVSLNKTSLTMKVGDTQTLVATVSPSDAADKSVSWSSNNTSVASVSSSGVVTAKAVGTATITVKTKDGDKTATCSVTVNPINVTGVSLNKNSMSLLVGETQTLTATVSPNNATDKSVTWSSNNTSVASVSSSGVVTAKAVGTATITVKTNDGGKTATCSVTVKSRDISGSGNEGTTEGELF